MVSNYNIQPGYVNAPRACLAKYKRGAVRYMLDQAKGQRFKKRGMTQEMKDLGRELGIVKEEAMLRLDS
jgi:hypothetical protein